jgi:HEPN domain-containing protein
VCCNGELGIELAGKYNSYCFFFQRCLAFAVKCKLGSLKAEISNCRV